MQVSVESTSALERRMTIGVPAERIETEVNKRLQQTARRAKVPGFRPGKVPMSVIRQRYEDSARQEALGDLIQATFYEAISRFTRKWSLDRRGERWHSADALAMAAALRPDGIVRAEDRHLAVELEGRLSRGATLVDWQQRTGKPANARIVLAYDQASFEAQVRAALGA